MHELIVIAVPDLMFQPRIEAAARALGYETAIADAPLAARDALARRPALAIVDVQATGVDAEAVIRGARAVKAKVLAFGRHTEPGALRTARRAGADVAVARSQLFDELPDLIRRLMGDAETPPTLTADKGLNQG
jgi:DNA-binding NarL/FixJ family response regulator